VKVEVEDRLSGVRPGVDDGAVSGLVRALLLRNLARHESQVPNSLLIFLRHGVDRLNVFLGNDENMDRRLGIHIFECQTGVVLKDNPGWHFFADKPAKQTVRHLSFSLPARRRTQMNVEDVDF
jgi:hypothetical protein